MSTRRLAAIMFTDIVGYTAMMQKSESHAVAVRSRHREVFERLHEQYQGTILQYYGDGTLSIFDSAVAATQCAIDMQLAFQEEPPVPLRIGIHTGDIIYSEQEAIGDGVNVAARVESIASAGSVMVSGQVAKYLNNQSDIPLLSMGHFAFKNVQEELEVFAVDREGLDVPNPKAITGKFSKHRAPNAKSGLAKVPVWARYLGGFALFLILAPIIYFPLYRTFSGSAANQDNLALQNLPAVSYEDQKRFYVSSFDNMGTDTTTDWLSLGIPYALEMDWDQDPHVLSIYPEGMEPAPMNSELEAAQNYKCDYLLRGNYEQKSDGYGIEISLYEVPNGQLFKQMSFWGEDFFSLLDTVSLETKKVLGVTEAELRTARDLPMRQILTNSIPAYRTLCQSYEGYLKQDYSKIGLYEKQAVGMDSSFAWAALMTATTAYSFLQSDEMAKKYIDLAMKHRKRLPEVFDAKVRQLNYRIADEPEKALELSKLLVELHPGNFSYRQNLINDYYSQDQFGAVMEQIEILQSLREDPCELFYLEGNTLLRMGEIKKGIERTLSCQRSYPNNASLAQTLGELYLADEQYEKARQSFQRAELLESSYLDWDKLEPHLSYMQDSIDRKDLPDLYENLVARYYHNRSTLFYFDVNTNGQLLFINGPRQQKYPYYPVGGNRFVATTGHEATFYFDESGKPSSVDAKEPSGRSYTLRFVPKKLDEARLSLIQRDVAAAESAFGEITETDKKGWVYETIESILAFREAGPLKIEGVSGTYQDEQGIGMTIKETKSGALEFNWLPSTRDDRFPLHALNESELVCLQMFDRNFVLIRQNGIVTKVEIQYPDRDAKILNRQSD